MSVRMKNVWVAHSIVVVCLFTVVGTWAFEMARSDDFLHLNRVFALAGISATIFHTMLTTGLVAAWARRPVTVVGIHLLGAAATFAVLSSTCVGIR